MSDRAAAGASPPVLVLAEAERFGVVTHELRHRVDGAGESLDLVLTVAEPAEDRDDRDVLVLVSPVGFSGVGGEAGHLLLTVRPVGPGPVTVRRVGWRSAGDGAVPAADPAVVIEAGSGSTVEGRWSYSRQPRLRSVFVADDEGAFGEEAAVLHRVGLSLEAAVPAVEPIDDRWVALTFTTPGWLSGQIPAADRCERFVERFGEATGSADLRIPESMATVEALDAAARAVEADGGPELDATLELGGREVVRGRRIKPLARYPITVVDAASGEPRAATLGCAVS